MIVPSWLDRCCPLVCCHTVALSQELCGGSTTSVLLTTSLSALRALGECSPDEATSESMDTSVFKKRRLIPSFIAFLRS